VKECQATDNRDVPLIESSSYRPPWWLPGGHLQTIAPSLFRRLKPVATLHERLELEDGDFLDLAWSGKTAKRLAVLSHGLEGSSNGSYIQSMAATLAGAGWDVLAWNFRGCGTDPNRLLSFYHSGATHDLDAVISHALENHPAEVVDLVGFSLGGNLTLKYLGENRTRPSRLHRAIAFSVPCDLADSAAKLSEPGNRVYMVRFLQSLRAKLRRKDEIFPGQLDLTGLDSIRTFVEFDDRFTAPLHGFKDADDYWTRSSCRQFLPDIRLPALLVNAMNDPFLGRRCFPAEEAAESEFFHLETPAGGGHVGFPDASGCWMGTRTVDWLDAAGQSLDIIRP
jgi:predicted alpha/beta-fold hydrolase